MTITSMIGGSRRQPPVLVPVASVQGRRKIEQGKIVNERVMLRIGTVSLALGLVTAIIFAALHPAREHPNDNPRVFAEYAQSGDRTTIHLGQLTGALLLITGLGVLASSLELGPPVSAAWARSTPSRSPWSD
jgi:hypothetical protein